MIVNDETVKFIFNSNFKWKNYEENFEKLILNTKEPVHVIWDFTEMNKIPSINIISKQSLLLISNKNKIKKNVLTNTVLVTSLELKNKIEDIFTTIYRPDSPTQVILQSALNF
tara:strand:+ start:321 stop:659 length:339 start_codon:yes stop_codon:yes gene_type:complete